MANKFQFNNSTVEINIDVESLEAFEECMMMVGKLLASNNFDPDYEDAVEIPVIIDELRATPDSNTDMYCQCPKCEAYSDITEEQLAKGEFHCPICKFSNRVTEGRLPVSYTCEGCGKNHLVFVCDNICNDYLYCEDCDFVTHIQYNWYTGEYDVNPDV